MPIIKPEILEERRSRIVSFCLDEPRTIDQIMGSIGLTYAVVWAEMKGLVGAKRLQMHGGGKGFSKVYKAAQEMQCNTCGAKFSPVTWPCPNCAQKVENIAEKQKGWDKKRLELQKELDLRRKALGRLESEASVSDREYEEKHRVIDPRSLQTVDSEIKEVLEKETAEDFRKARSTHADNVRAEVEQLERQIMEPKALDSHFGEQKNQIQIQQRAKGLSEQDAQVRKGKIMESLAVNKRWLVEDLQRLKETPNSEPIKRSVELKEIKIKELEAELSVLSPEPTPEPNPDGSSKNDEPVQDPS